ncbi:MAG: outer membrane protein assembly factor BamD [Thermodesulfovibrionales bacterium]
MKFHEKRLLFMPVHCLLILLLLITASCSGKKEVRPEGPFDAEKMLVRANELIDKKEFEDARKILLEVKNRDLTKKYAPLAQLKIADSYVKEEEFDLAIEEYKRFLDIYPDHKNAPYAQYQIAMTYFIQIESPERGYGAAAKALEEFERLKRLFPRNPYKELIDLRIEKCRNTMAEYEFLVGEFYFKKGAYNAALKRYHHLLSRFPDYKKESHVLYNIALSYKRLGERDKAVEYLNRLIEKYPNDRLIKEAKKELASLSKQ